MEKKITKQGILDSVSGYEELQFLVNDKALDKFAFLAEQGRCLDLKDAIGTLVGGFIDNCGVSAGFRTIYFDTANTLFDKFIKTDHPLAKELKEELFYDVMDKFNDNYTDEFDKYDISLLELHGYWSLCKEEIGCNNDTVRVEALCYGMWLLLKDYSHITDEQ